MTDFFHTIFCRKIVKPSGIYAIISAFILLLFINFLWRVVFILAHGIIQTPSDVLLYAKALIIGLRLDIVIAGYLSIPVILTIYLPFIGWRWQFYRWLFTVYMMLAIGFISFLFLFDIEFYREFGGHINFMLLHNGGNQEEIWTFFWNEYPLLLYAGILLAILVVSYRILRSIRLWIESKPGISVSASLILILVTFSGVVLSCRGGWQERPINWGYAMFSDNMTVNQSALNGVFFFGRSVVELSSESHLLKAISYYPKEESENITRLLLSETAAEPDPVFQDASPNIMILILESHTGALCGYLDPEYSGVTPFLDELASKGISFSRCYSSGHRSAHGIGSILTGIPTLPGLPIIYQVESMKGIPSMGNVFSKNGYVTSFFYGGDANYDNMAGFARINGFQNIYDQKDLPDDATGTAWGKFDHILFENIGKIQNTLKEPFISVVFTTTNHQPWKIPVQYNTIIPNFTDPNYNRSETMRTMNYVDTVIREFFENFKNKPWFMNTIFIITADHGLRNNTHNRDDLINAIIPLVVYNPQNHDSGKNINTVCSQTDIFPLALNLANIDHSMLQLKGVNPIRKKFGFACRIVNDEIYWIEKDYVYKEILDQNYFIEDLRSGKKLSSFDNHPELLDIQKNCRGYLESSYFYLKTNNEVGNNN